MKDIIYKYKTLLLLIALYLGTIISAQAQNISINGKVINEQGEAITLANIVALSLPDSVIISYALTNNNGGYSLSIKKEGDIIVRASYLGYNTQEKNIVATSANQKVDFVMREQTEELSQVIVKGRMLGAKIKGDTISYNLSKFVDGTEQTLNDLLSKLPGIEVDENGKVKAQGKEIDKLLIDGKEYFINQSQLVTKNLSAKMVESVDLMNNYNDVGMLADSKPQGISALNIGIKEGYKGKITGVLSGAGGIESKYAGRANLFQFNNNLGLAFIGDANNTGEMAFTLQDYISFQGGINNFLRSAKGSGGAGGMTSINLQDVPVLSFSDAVKSKTGETGAINLSYIPSNKFKVNSYAIGNFQRQSGEQQRKRWLADNQNSLVANEELRGNNEFSFLNAYLSMDYEPSKKFYISNRTMLALQKRNSNTQIINSYRQINDTIDTDNNVSTFDLKNYFLMMGKTNHGDILSLDAYYRMYKKPNSTDISSLSQLLGLPLLPPNAGSPYKLVQDNEQAAHEFSLQTEYSRKQQWLFIKPYAGLSYFSQGLNTKLFQQVNGINQNFLPANDYMNDISYSNLDAFTGVSFQKNTGLFRFQLGVGAHYYLTNFTNLNNKKPESNKWQFTPQLSTSLHFSTAHFLSASIGISQKLQSTENLAEGFIAESYRLGVRGENLNYLQRGLDMSLMYNLYDLFTNTSVMAAVNYSENKNASAYNYKTYPRYSEAWIVQSPDVKNLNAVARFKKGLYSVPLNIKINGNYTFRSNYNYLEGIENRIDMNSVRTSASVESVSKGVLNGEAGINLAWVNNASKANNVSNSMFTKTPFAMLKVNAGKGWLLTSEMRYEMYDAKAMLKDVCLLNAVLHYKPVKSHFEFELNANNMLNLNQTAKLVSSYSENYFEEMLYQTLPGYVVFKLTYRL